jgi:electron transfer flavoprotein beta subunit
VKIVVLCKAVATGVSDVKIATGGKVLQYQSQPLTMNESDEYALEEAIVLKRAHGGEVTVLTMGSITTQNILHLALAKGADRAMRIDAQIQDSQAASIVLAAALRKLEYDLVLTGTQSRDTLSGLAGIAIAERLEIPFAFAVTQVEMDGDKSIRVLKELGGGRSASVKLPLPALLCVQTGIQKLTYVPPARMLRARQQPVRSFSLGDLGLTEDQIVAQGYHFLDVFLPTRTGQVQFLQGSAQEVATTLFAKIKEVM